MSVLAQLKQIIDNFHKKYVLKLPILFCYNLLEITNLILAIVLTISTALLTFYTYLLVTETRKARKATIQPFVSISLEQAETDITLLFIVFRNYGQGGAYDLHFNIKKDYDFNNEDKLSSIGLFKQGMKFCPPSYTKKFFLTDTSDGYEEKMKKEINLDVKYKNAYGESNLQNFHIKLSEMVKSSSITPSDSHIGRITEYLNEIKDLLTMNTKANNRQ